MDSGFSPTVVMVRIVGKLSVEKDDQMQWHMQAENITTNIKVKVDFNLPALSATNVVTWRCHVDDSDKGRYDIFLVQYIFNIIKIKSKII